jgi:hypothetical protein
VKDDKVQADIDDLLSRLSSGEGAYQCWYCEETIVREGLDPCAVILVANWAEGKGNQREQQFFAHAECFRQSGSGKDLYVLDPGFEPNA